MSPQYAKYWVGIAVVALIATGCASSNSPATQSTSRSYNGANYNGEWQLVRSSSDRYVPRDEWALPNVFRIRGDSQTLSILDDSGTLVAEIALDSDYPYAWAADRDAQDRARGHWANSREFVVDRLDRYGRRSTQTFTLDRNGEMLVVKLEMEGDRGRRSFERVYERV